VYIDIDNENNFESENKKWHYPGFIFFGLIKTMFKTSKSIMIFYLWYLWYSMCIHFIWIYNLFNFQVIEFDLKVRLGFS